MKAKQIVVFFSALFILLSAPQLFGQQKKGKETVAFYVDGLNCTNCQAKIEKNIAFEKGVSDIQCDLKSKVVKVTYKTNKTNSEKLVKKFDKIGFPAQKMEE